MKAIGFTSGIGSMLVGAKKLGFDVLGNIEWRRYYHHRDKEGKNTFEENFPGAFLVKSPEDLTEEQIAELHGLDLAMGHPECGNYSTLSATVMGKSLSEMNKDAGDIPVFVDLIKRFRPKYFVQDNLPKSLIGYTMEEWAEELPEYDLFPEWISNWGYGNVQKYRNRFFMIGALKEEGYVFVPNERETGWNLRHTLENIPSINNDPHTLDGRISKGKGIFSDEHMSWKEYRKYMESAEEGSTIPYLANDGTWKKHVGWRKAFKDGYVPVITGGAAIANPFTNMPFSMRERARIQGLPDDFIFYGTKLEENGGWNHMKNSAMIKQTGKCMPVQFCTYVVNQIKHHMNSNPFYCMNGGERIIKPNPLVTEAKKWYCQNVGYSNQDGACQYCWIKNC